MNEAHPTTVTDRYARCIAASKRANWRLEEDVIRGRELAMSHKFLPDRLSLVRSLDFLSDEEQKFVSQIQGRTYANIFGLVERFINAKLLEVTRDHWLGDQVALEALVRFSAEELKHQRLFARIEQLADQVMPEGYRFAPDPNDIAQAVLGKSTWAVLALTCLIELFTQQHYKSSIEPDAELSGLFKDVFLFHWKEESQHAVLDELEWQREHDKLSSTEVDLAVDDLIALVGAVDTMLQVQAQADAEYFARATPRPVSEAEQSALARGTLCAYRHQYIGCGVRETRFPQILAGFLTITQGERVQQALQPLL